MLPITDLGGGLVWLTGFGEFVLVALSVCVVLGFWCLQLCFDLLRLYLDVCRRDAFCWWCVGVIWASFFWAALMTCVIV